jgi:hypothetical protein
MGFFLHLNGRELLMALLGTLMGQFDFGYGFEAYVSWRKVIYQWDLWVCHGVAD